MSGEMWTGWWAYWTVIQLAGVMIASVEWWLARDAARDALRRSPVGLVDASWALARAQGRLQMMLVVAMCWALASGIGWICVRRV
jgi:hypothetical protein